ncbi:glycine-rich RNA-binding protein 2 [Actinidia rufa]|uniref:Glycine-rich RNA-binding protein 2 n=1 Tax=Actinidia rufa TaxID=165716 RepID=A0A7J0E9A5_9ERIC|nr:glycine-rich RNA-binding protein 2 [Actinidia rufa]
MKGVSLALFLDFAILFVVVLCVSIIFRCVLGRPLHAGAGSHIGGHHGAGGGNRIGGHRSAMSMFTTTHHGGGGGDFGGVGGHGGGGGHHGGGGAC